MRPMSVRKHPERWTRVRRTPLQRTARSTRSLVLATAALGAVLAMHPPVAAQENQCGSIMTRREWQQQWDKLQQELSQNIHDWMDTVLDSLPEYPSGGLAGPGYDQELRHQVDPARVPRPGRRDRATIDADIRHLEAYYRRCLALPDVVFEETLIFAGVKGRWRLTSCNGLGGLWNIEWELTVDWPADAMHAEVTGAAQFSLPSTPQRGDSASFTVTVDGVAHQEAYPRSKAFVHIVFKKYVVEVVSNCPPYSLRVIPGQWDIAQTQVLLDSPPDLPNVFEFSSSIEGTPRVVGLSRTVLLECGTRSGP